MSVSSISSAAMGSVMQPVQGRQVKTLTTTDGRVRDYIMYVPSSYNPKKPAPMVIALHGGTGNAAQLEKQIGMNKIAEEEGFIVVYPNGINEHWNDGNVGDPTVDDVQFISQMIDDVKKKYKVDDNRIFATGISNGAIMAGYLAQKLPNKIAAIAQVAGSIPVVNQSNTLSGPTSVLMINGTEDNLVPYNGGTLGSRGTVLSHSDAISEWIKDNGGLAKRFPVKKEVIPDIEEDDMVSSKTNYRTLSGADVVSVDVSGGGHTWPGTYNGLPKSLVGNTTKDFNASEMIWQFFEEHPKIHEETPKTYEEPPKEEPSKLRSIFSSAVSFVSSAIDRLVSFFKG